MRTKYEKRWRHSYLASYSIFKTKFYGAEDGTASEEKIEDIENVWHFRPGHKLFDMDQSAAGSNPDSTIIFTAGLLVY